MRPDATVDVFLLGITVRLLLGYTGRVNQTNQRDPETNKYTHTVEMFTKLRTLPSLSSMSVGSVPLVQMMVRFC